MPVARRTGQFRTYAATDEHERSFVAAQPCIAVARTVRGILEERQRAGALVPAPFPFEVATSDKSIGIAPRPVAHLRAGGADEAEAAAVPRAAGAGGACRERGVAAEVRGACRLRGKGSSAQGAARRSCTASNPSRDGSKCGVAAGESAIFHCRGGRGRARLMAACAIVSLGDKPEAEMMRVRRARPGATETREQELFVTRCTSGRGRSLSA